MPSRLRRIIQRFQPDPGRAWDIVARTAVTLCLLVVPLLIIPLTLDAWELHKHAAVLGLTAIGWLAWLVAALRRRSAAFGWDRLDLLVVGIVTVAGLGTLWSSDRVLSLYGVSGSISESFPATVSLAALFVLARRVFSEAGERRLAWIGLGTGVGAALLLMIFQLSGWSLLPTNFTDQAWLSTLSNSADEIAAVASLFAAVGLLGWPRARERWQQTAVIGGVALGLTVVLFMGDWISWIIFSLGVIAVLMDGARNPKLARPGLVVAGALLAALGLIWSASQFPKTTGVARPEPVRLDQATNWTIATTALQRAPIIGTGPGTWLTDFVRYRSTDFNNSPFWANRFIKARWQWSQTMATGGVLGVAAWLTTFAWLGTALWRRWRRDGRIESLIGLLVVAAWFVSGWMMTWGFTWLFIGWVAAALAFVPERLEKKTVGLGFPLAFVLAAVAALLLGWSVVRVYASAVTTNQARDGIAGTEALDQVQARLQRAVNWHSYNLEANTLLAEAYATEGELAIRSGDTNGANIAFGKAVSIMTDMIDRWPNNPAVYEDMNNILNRMSTSVSDVEIQARQNFEALRRLEPASPIHDLGIGQTYLLTRSRTLGDVQNTNQELAAKLLADAIASFDRALEKKPDYVLAEFAKVQAYNASQQYDQAEAALGRLGSVLDNLAAYWRERGVTEFGLGRPDNGNAAFDRALTIEPNDALTYLTYSQALEDAGQRDQAKSVLQRGLDRLPNQTTLRAKLNELNS